MIIPNMWKIENLPNHQSLCDIAEFSGSLPNSVIRNTKSSLHLLKPKMSIKIQDRNGNHKHSQFRKCSPSNSWLVGG